MKRWSWLLTKADDIKGKTVALFDGSVKKDSFHVGIEERFLEIKWFRIFVIQRVPELKFVKTQKVCSYTIEQYRATAPQRKTVRVKGLMSLRNGMWLDLRNVLIYEEWLREIN